MKNGMVIIDAEKTDKIQLVLNGAKISSSTSAAVYVKQADKVFLTTAANTKNKLSNGGTYEAIDDNHIDAVIYSKDDLTLNGKGLLKINAKSGHGIVSKDSLVLTGGRYVITAEKHGLSGKDDICIANGSYRITSGKDGIHAENDDDAAYGFLYISNGTFHITSEGDGISSSYFGQIEGGSFNILAGGGCQSSSSTSGQQTAQPGQTAQSVNFIQNPSEQDPFGKNPPDFKQPDTQTSASDDDTASTKGIKAVEICGWMAARLSSTRQMMHCIRTAALPLLTAAIRLPQATTAFTQTTAPSFPAEQSILHKAMKALKAQKWKYQAEKFMSYLMTTESTVLHRMIHLRLTIQVEKS